MKPIILLVTFLYFSLVFSINLKENLSFLSTIDDFHNENENDYSPFAPTSSDSDVREDLQNINPVENSIEISTITNQFTNVLTEKKKPVITELPKISDNYVEIRKNFKEPSKMHIHYYLNSGY